MRALRIIALLTLALPLAAGCGDAPDASSCTALVAHLIDLEMAAGAVPEAELEVRRAELEAELGDRSRTFCRDKLPEAQVACGLRATIKAELAACDRA